MNELDNLVNLSATVNSSLLLVLETKTYCKYTRNHISETVFPGTFLLITLAIKVSESKQKYMLKAQIKIQMLVPLVFF